MKRLLSIITALSVTLVSLTTSASILGNEVIYTTTQKFGEGTYYTKNIFYSDQSGVGKQTEYYFEYTPNDTIKPAIVNGSALYGKRTVKEMANSMINDGMYPLMLLNADFFSLQTGVPMSDCAAYGEIITKGGVGTDAIGINEDGTAFMSWLHIYTTINVDGNTINADLINKYRQPYALYMLTDKFGTKTRATGSGTNVIIGSLSDNIRINNTVTGVVEKVIHTNGSVDIPPGKVVLTLDDKAAKERQDEIALFKEGQTVTFNSSAQGDARWNDAKYILGATGGRIITNGTITNADQAAAPRSAVGITAQGKLIFYALDGRQSGHSYGARLNTLAKRLKELGCVDAINLDGGGSTSLMSIFPGHSDPTLINSPSDGSLRPVANFLALVNTKQATGVLSDLSIYPFTGYYLQGANQEITVLGMDSASHAAQAGDVTLSGTGMDINGTNVTFTQPGDITLTAQSNAVTGSTVYHVYDKPTAIYFYNKSNNKTISSIQLKTEESISLGANAYHGHIALTGHSGLYKWSADESIGTITADGVFKSTDRAASGNIYVTAGKTTKSIPVTVVDPNNLYDESKFTTADLSYTDGAFKAVITNNDRAKVERSKIKLKVDGSVIDSFDFTDGVITCNIPGTGMHKITLEITNGYNRTNYFSYTTDGSISNNRFSDVAGHWAQNYIKYMNNHGIVNGVQTSKGFAFLPSNNITRGEFAVMTANFLGLNAADYKSVSLPYSDLGSIPDWALNQVKAMYSLGIITGKLSPNGTTTYESSAPITRCEVAVIISRLLLDTTVMKKPAASDYSSIPTWARDGFDKACGAGIISGYEDGTVKPLNNVTRAEAVKMFYSMF